MHTSWLEQHLSGHGALLVGALVMALIVGPLMSQVGGTTEIQVGGKPGTRPAPFRAMLLGADGRLSTSKTITAAWTILIGFALTTLATISIAKNQNLTGLANPLSDTYLLLLGGPFAALVLAKGITVTRLQNGSLQKSTTAPVFDLNDLTSNDAGQTDLVDFQFVAFNAIAMLYVLIKVIQDPTQLPQIPTLLAELTSLSALTYTGNKAVADSTPKIDSVKVTNGNQVTVTGTGLGGADASLTLTTAGGVQSLVPVPAIDQTDTKLVFQSTGNIAAGTPVTVAVALPSGAILQSTAPAQV